MQNMSEPLKGKQSVYVVMRMRDGRTPTCEGVLPTLEDAKKYARNIEQDYGFEREWKSDVEGRILQCIEHDGAWIGIQKVDFPSWVFIQGWTEDHKQILSDGTIRPVKQYCIESERYIETLKHKQEFDSVIKLRPFVDEVLAALGLPKDAWVNDYMEVEDYEAIDKQAIKRAEEILQIEVQSCWHIVTLAKNLKEAREVASEIKVGDSVRVFHLLGDGSHSTYGIVRKIDGFKFTIEEYAVDNWYWDDENNVGGGFVLPASMLKTYEPWDVDIALSENPLLVRNEYDKSEWPEGEYPVVGYGPDDSGRLFWNEAAVEKIAKAFNLTVRKRPEDGMPFAWAKIPNVK